MARRAADDRHGVRHRGAEAHPAAFLAPVEAGEPAAGIAVEDLGAAPVRRRREAAQFHRAGDAQAVLQWRADEATLGRIDRQPELGAGVRQGQVIAALGVEQRAGAEHGGEALGPRAGGDRSEEHTSELQSPMRTSYAGFCLKKKKNNKSEISEQNELNGNQSANTTNELFQTFFQLLVTQNKRLTQSQRTNSAKYGF